jgi:membrane dipeptidase
MYLYNRWLARGSFLVNQSMTHSRVLVFLCLILVASAANAQSPNISAEPISAKARAIQESAIVIDTHADTPQRFLDEGFDMGSTDPHDIGHMSLDKARRGDLEAEFFSIWVDPETNQGHFAQHTFDLIDAVYEQAARHPDRMMMAFSVADIALTHREHKLAALMGIEGGHSIENDMHLLRDYYRLGVRYMTLSWSNTNEWADSSGDMMMRRFSITTGSRILASK